MLEAADGRAALDVIGREDVDLVILDLGLPDIIVRQLSRLSKAGMAAAYAALAVGFAAGSSLARSRHP